MNRTLRLGLLSLVFLAQLATPAWMLGQREVALKTGEVFKFKTAPVDPVDAFRGRYVALSFEESTAPWAGQGEMPYSGSVYVELTVGEDGFAKLGRATREKPATGPCLKAQIWTTDTDNRLRLQLPFDRYYMNEAKAPEAERVYFEHNRIGIHDAYVTVRIRNGVAVLEQLYVADQPIEEFIDAQP